MKTDSKTRNDRRSDLHGGRTSYVSRAFTLVELLVVIAIIAIMTGIIVTNLTSSRSKARDAERISDIGQIQLALELYYDRCRVYPTSLATTVANGCPTTPVAINLGTFISVIPKDPSTAISYGYYRSDTDYALRAQLENYNDVLVDDIDGTVFGQTNYCGSANNGQGTSERYYCVNPR